MLVFTVPSKNGAELVAVFSALAMCNNAALEVAMLACGIGIVRLPLFTCEQEVVSGALKIIVQDYDQINLKGVIPRSRMVIPFSRFAT